MICGINKLSLYMTQNVCLPYRCMKCITGMKHYILTILNKPPLSTIKKKEENNNHNNKKNNSSLRYFKIYFGNDKSSSFPSQQ